MVLYTFARTFIGLLLIPILSQAQFNSNGEIRRLKSYREHVSESQKFSNERESLKPEWIKEKEDQRRLKEAQLEAYLKEKKRQLANPTPLSNPVSELHSQIREREQRDRGAEIWNNQKKDYERLLGAARKSHEFPTAEEEYQIPEPRPRVTPKRREELANKIALQNKNAGLASSGGGGGSSSSSGGGFPPPPPPTSSNSVSSGDFQVPPPPGDFFEGDFPPPPDIEPDLGAPIDPNSGLSVSQPPGNGSFE